LWQKLRRHCPVASGAFSENTAPIFIPLQRPPAETPHSSQMRMAAVVLGAFIPKAIVIVSAKMVRRTSLSRAVKIFSFEIGSDFLVPTMTEISEDAESLVSETHDRTIHQNSGRPNRPSAWAYQQSCFALDCNVVTVSDKFSLILFDSLFGPLGQLNIPHR
jgi:hypothetical protein